jgi:transposase-like protein
VDKAGQTIDFLLTAYRDKKAALRFLKKAIRHHGLPEKVTMYLLKISWRIRTRMQFSFALLPDQLRQ